MSLRALWVIILPTALPQALLVIDHTPDVITRALVLERQTMLQIWECTAGMGAFANNTLYMGGADESPSQGTAMMMIHGREDVEGSSPIGGSGPV